MGGESSGEELSPKSRNQSPVLNKQCYQRVHSGFMAEDSRSRLEDLFFKVYDSVLNMYVRACHTRLTAQVEGGLVLCFLEGSGFKLCICWFWWSC